MIAIGFVVFMCSENRCLATNAYIEKHNEVTFFKSPECHEKVDLFSVNLELLEAAIYFTINQSQKGKGTLNYHPVLDSLSQYYANRLASRYYKQPDLGTHYVKKRYRRKDIRSTGYKGALWKVGFGYNKLYRYPKRTLLNLQLAGDTVQSDRYVFSLRRGENAKTEEVHYHTYASLAKSILYKMKRSLRGYRSGIYSDVGCQIKIDQASFKKRNARPSLCVMIFLGGHRLKMVSKSMN